MDAQDAKILGVILGVALARWWVAHENAPRRPTSGPDWGPDYLARYRALHPPRPSLATRAGRAWGHLSVAIDRRRR